MRIGRGGGISATALEATAPIDGVAARTPRLRPVDFA
jgi:hypothetical protein